MANMNNRGQMFAGLIIFIAVSFFFTIFLGTMLYLYGEVDSALADIPVQNGVNISNYSAQTIGAINLALINSADLIGILFIFGTVLAMGLAGFLTRNSTNRLMLVVDFIVIIFAYLLAVYVSNAYESVLAQLPFTNLIASNLSKTSSILLNLPLLTAVAGAFTMILTYAGIPKSGEGDNPVPGI